MEKLEAPPTLKMLGDELTEVVELMRAFMRKMDAGGDALAATCTGWWLLYHALKAEGDMRRFRVSLKKARVFASYGWKDAREAARLTGAMEGHVNKAYGVTKNPLVMLRSAWFLAYAAIKLRALDCQYLDMSLRTPPDYKGIPIPDAAEAAKQGDTSAQFHLGFKYADGEGVPQDAVQAYAWFNIVAGQGDQRAKEAREVYGRVHDS